MKQEDKTRDADMELNPMLNPSTEAAPRTAATFNDLTLHLLYLSSV